MNFVREEGNAVEVWKWVGWEGYHSMDRVSADPNYRALVSACAY